MTQANFIDNSTITVIVRDGEKISLKTHLPVSVDEQQGLTKLIAHYFEEEFTDDKSSMVYWVLMKMMSNVGVSFSYEGSDRSEERERIGARIRQLREEKQMEARHLAALANIDAANLSRIEKGKYSVGLDILVKISQALGVKVDLV